MLPIVHMLSNKERLFKIKTITPCGKEFVDWYYGDTLKKALVDYDEDLHRYGLPSDCKREIAECHPVTLKLV